MKKQKNFTFSVENIKKLGNNDAIFFSLLAIVILVCFLVFTPKVSSYLFPQKRVLLWQNFLTDVKKQNQINPQKYWEFREFYSPGYFEFSRNGFSNNQTQKSLQQIGIPLTNETILPVLAFQSPYLQSLDLLTPTGTLSSYVTIPAKQLIFQNKSSLIYEQDAKTVNIVFLFPESEMKKANGFFDYAEKDKEFVKGKYWLNITKITLP